MDELANKYPDIHILEVDVDDNDVGVLLGKFVLGFLLLLQELAKEYGVKAMPTFFYFVNGVRQPIELTGANADRLRSDVEQLIPKKGKDTQ